MAEFLAEIEKLLAEDPASVVAREHHAFEALAGPPPFRLVLHGAGKLGRKILTALRGLGIEPLAFADNSPSLWDTVIDGLAVLPPAEAVRKFGPDPTWLVTIWGSGSTHRYDRTREQLRGLGVIRIAPAGLLFWRFPETFLPYYALDLPTRVYEQAKDVLLASRSFADEESRQEFLRQLRFRTHLDFDGLESPRDVSQYFPRDLFQLGSEEVFVDVGAWSGDTIAEFLSRVSGFRRILAFEPDPKTFSELEQYVARLPSDVRDRIALYPTAAGRTTEKLRFRGLGTLSSGIAGDGDIEVAAAPLDSVLRDASPTFLKMDIEGSELDAIAGAAETLQRFEPILAICVYHRQDHLWRVPLALRALSARYDLYLRAHGEECWDVVCYAVPRARRR